MRITENNKSNGRTAMVLKKRVLNIWYLFFILLKYKTDYLISFIPLVLLFNCLSFTDVTLFLFLQISIFSLLKIFRLHKAKFLNLLFYLQYWIYSVYWHFIYPMPLFQLESFSLIFASLFYREWEYCKIVKQIALIRKCVTFYIFTKIKYLLRPQLFRNLH